MYPYVGTRKIAERSRFAPTGVRIDSPEDVLRWIRETSQELDAAGEVIATFVVDETGWLRVADRRSEHVACASGSPVRAAGEMTFEVKKGTVSVTWVTNQSTGYCPEPDSWPAVQTALIRAGMASPDSFHQAFNFRRCPRCGTTNIVKDGVFECGVCSTPLPEEWNFDVEIAAPAPLEKDTRRRASRGGSR
jgi:hypothetical protein